LALRVHGERKGKEVRGFGAVGIVPARPERGGGGGWLNEDRLEAKKKKSGDDPEEGAARARGDPNERTERKRPGR